MNGHDLYLPFEETFKRVALRGNIWFLAAWGGAFSAACVAGMFHSVHNSWPTLEHRYLAPILIGNAVIFGNILFILGTTELVRNNLPVAIGLLASSADREASRLYLARKMFGIRRLAVPSVLVFALGLTTFTWLGIDLPHATTRIWFTVALCAIFGLLGTTIGLGTGFWMWMWDFGKRHPRVDVFHPDKMGGLLPVAHVSDWVITVGSILAALYSLGAYLSPYAHENLRAFSYLWVVAAVALLVFAFIVPALSVHECLTHARQKVADRLSRHNERLFARFESDALDRPADIIALKWFSESLSKLNVWPYRQVVARFSLTAALQLSPLLINLVHYVKAHWHQV